MGEGTGHFPVGMMRQKHRGAEVGPLQSSYLGRRAFMTSPWLFQLLMTVTQQGY